MNANDIFTALTGIDEKYIDEAAYELIPATALPVRKIRFRPAKWLT